MNKQEALSLLDRAVAAQRELDEKISAYIYALGRSGEFTLTYADIGRATGMTRQSAHQRWPGAVKNARPGRPKKEK